MIAGTSHVRAAAPLWLVIAGLACASAPPGLDLARLDTGEGALLLISYTGTNRLEPRYPPRLMAFDALRNPTEDDAVSRPLVVEDGTASDDWPLDHPEEMRVEALFYLPLAPGRYGLHRLRGAAWPVQGSALAEGAGGSADPTPGYFNFPFDAEFDVAGGEVAYLGHLEVVNREAHGDQPRSGGPQPEPHQLSSGMSNGTLAIRLTQQWDTDAEAFRARYPALRDREIRVLPTPGSD